MGRGNMHEGKPSVKHTRTTASHTGAASGTVKSLRCFDNRDEQRQSGDWKLSEAPDPWLAGVYRGTRFAPAKRA